MKRITGTELRRRLAESDGLTCVWCSRTLKLEPGPGLKLHATLDHLKPQYSSSDHTEQNLVLACQPCNSRRGHTHAYLFYLLQVIKGEAPRGAVLLPKLRVNDLLPFNDGLSLPDSVEAAFALPLQRSWRKRLFKALSAERATAIRTAEEEKRRRAEEGSGYGQDDMASSLNHGTALLAEAA